MYAETKAAIQLFDEAILWLKDNYRRFRFFTERDIVWKLQLHLLEEIERQHLPLKVFDNHKMPNKTQVDLAILEQGAGAGSVPIVVELKYEPDHNRDDISPGKFPKVFWDSEKNHGVVQDISRITALVNDVFSEVGYVIFVDEGGHHSKRREAPNGSSWDYSWGKSPYSEKTMAVLLSKRQRE